MTEFDPDKVEWPQEGFAHPAYEHKMPPGADHPGNVAMYYDDPPLVVPAEALREAAERIKELEDQQVSGRQRVEAIMDGLMKTEAQEMMEGRVGKAAATREAWRPDAETIATALLPLEVTDEITVKLDRGTAEYLLLVGTDEQSGEYFSDTYQGKVMPALRAALTQKGEA